MHNIFFALRPPPAMAERVVGFTEALRQRCGLEGAALPPERLHISLCSLGEHRQMPDELLSRACAAVSNATMGPFSLALDRVASFQTKTGLRPVVMFGDDGVIGVDLLHAAIRTALADALLIRRRGRPITPHLTLLRDKAEVPEEQIETMGWTVHEFVLIDSLYGQGRHDILGRWRLPLNATRS